MNMVKSELAHIDRYEGSLDQAEGRVSRDHSGNGNDWATGLRLRISWKASAMSPWRTRTQRAAGRLFAAAEALRESTGIAMTPLERKEYDGAVAAVRGAMPEITFASAWAEGRAMSMDQAIAYALESKSDLPVQK